jgi:hypothetical protein
LPGVAAFGVIEGLGVPALGVIEGLGVAALGVLAIDARLFPTGVPGLDEFNRDLRLKSMFNISVTTSFIEK